jgi:hypothetical protein
MREVRPKRLEIGLRADKRSPRGGKSHAIAAIDPHWYPPRVEPALFEVPGCLKSRPAVSISDCGGHGVVLLLFVAQSLPASKSWNRLLDQAGNYAAINS